MYGIGTYFALERLNSKIHAMNGVDFAVSGNSPK